MTLNDMTFDMTFHISHASVHVRHLDFCSGEQFFKFTVGEENLFPSCCFG